MTSFTSMYPPIELTAGLPGKIPPEFQRIALCSLIPIPSHHIFDRPDVAHNSPPWMILWTVVRKRYGRETAEYEINKLGRTATGHLFTLWAAEITIVVSLFLIFAESITLPTTQLPNQPHQILLENKQPSASPAVSHLSLLVCPLLAELDNFAAPLYCLNQRQLLHRKPHLR